MNKTKIKAFFHIDKFEFLCLMMVFLGIAVDIIYNREHILFRLLRMFYVPAYIFFAGMLCKKYKDQPSELLKKSGLYFLIFVFLGTLREYYFNPKFVSDIFINLLTGIKVPKQVEIFFSMAVVFFCCWILAKQADFFCRHKRIFAVLGIAALAFAFLPSDIYSYPVLGVFIGSRFTSCTPVLPYFGYFLAGMYASTIDKKCVKKGLILSLTVTVLSCPLALTPLKPVAYITITAFPVYLAYLIAACFVPYKKLLSALKQLAEKCFRSFVRFIEKMQAGKTTNLILYFVTYTAVFAVVAFLVFYSFIDNNLSIVWHHDAIAQYVPRVYYFIDYIKSVAAQVLQGDFNIPMYDFSIGLGNAISFSFEPIYWLYPLFESANVEFAYNFILIFRFFVAGISMSIMLKYFQKSNFQMLFGSIMYTFCGFAIYAGTLHGHFISPMIMFPLLVIAAEELYLRKRWYLCTVFVALSLLSSYYFLYMSSLAMGLYYLARFLFSKDKERKNLKYFIGSAFTFAFSYILGAMIGNFPIFTSFTSYVSSGRTGTSTLATPTFFYYTKKWLLKCYLSFISVPDSPGLWLKLGFVPLAMIAIIILFIKKDHKLLKSCFIVLAAFCAFPVVAFIFSGFSSVTNRWCYIFAVLVTFITVQAIPQLHTLSKRELKLILAGILSYALITVLSSDFRTAPNLAALSLLLLNYLLILFMNQKIRLIGVRTGKAALLILCCISLMVNAYYQYSEGTNTTSGAFVEKGKVMDTMKDTPMVVFEDYEDQSFYRVSTPEIPLQQLCSSSVMGYNSIAIFSSTIDGPIVDYNREMANTAWNLVQLAGFDNRTFMNELASVKYYSATDDQEGLIPFGYEKTGEETVNGKKYNIYENKYALPLGYTYSTVISEEEFAGYSALEKQEILLQSAVVEDTSSVFLEESDNLTLSSQEAVITNYTANGIEIEDGLATITEGNATLTLEFDGVENSETYMELVGQFVPQGTLKDQILETVITSGSNCIEYTFRSTDHTYYTGQESYLFNLGYQKKGRNSVTITFKDTGTFEFDSFRIMCQPMNNYTSQIRQLSENVLEDVVMSDNLITGNITVDEDKLLVLSMPYQKGWTAYVDGKEVDILKANYMYMGLSLKEGSHEIELRYERPGLKLAVALSISGICIFIVALIIRHLRIKIKRGKKL